jgi:hypothetical protein
MKWILEKKLKPMGNYNVLIVDEMKYLYWIVNELIVLSGWFQQDM